jgi:WD40 repeat protein/serine/threonine protein kinase
MADTTEFPAASACDPAAAVSSRERLALLRADQRQRWLAGERVPAEWYLREAPALRADRELAVELIYAEYLLAEELGQAPSAETFVGRFPEYAERLRQQIELHRALDEQATSLATTAWPATGALPGPPPLVPGYEILGELGRGGMGVVYKAQQLGLNRTVALKMILAEQAGEEVVKRFRAEAEAVARLQHPNIVHIYEIGECDGRPFFSMEYVNGGSLEKYLGRAPQPPQATAQLLEVLARAVHVAHEAGIVHRDLKPANVLLQAIATKNTKSHQKEKDAAEEYAGHSSSNGLDSPFCDFLCFSWPFFPKITDFGLAKRIGGDSATTHPGVLVGTPSYMAPEHAEARGQAVGPAADVWALGAILYECLSGRPPFLGETPLDTLLQVIGDEPVPPSRLQPKVPRDLETICLKCLHKEANRRYASALALADDLRRFLKGEPVQARPTSLRERAWKWARRRPAVAALSLGVLLTAALSFGLVTWQWLRAEDEADRARIARQQAEESQQRERQRAEEAVRERARAEQGEKQANEARHESELTWGHLALDRGLVLCREGDVAPGLLWMADALRAPDADLRRAIRANLALWSCRLHPLRTVLDHPAHVSAAALAPDGKTLVTGRTDGVVCFWDSDKATLRSEVARHKGRVVFVVFSRDGTQLLTGGEDRTAQVWDVRTEKPSGPALKHPALLFTGAFSSDGGRVVIGCRDNRARLWDARTGEPRGELDHGSELRAIAVSPVGDLVVTAGSDSRSRGSARLWHADTLLPHRQPLEHFDRVNAVAFSKDGALLATSGGDRRVMVWATADGRPLSRNLVHPGVVHALTFSPDGNTVAAVGEDRAARLWPRRLWNQAGQPAVISLRHEGQVHALAFSRDGNLVLTGSADGTARLWQAAGGQQVGAAMHHRGPVSDVAFRPAGGMLLTRGAGTSVCLWEQGGGNGHLADFPHDRDMVHAGAFSRDGKFLVTGGKDCTARIWEVSTRRQVQLLEPPRSNAILAVAFSPEGKAVLTGSRQGEAYLWDIASGKQLGPLWHHPNLTLAVAFHPDGRVAATGGSNGVLQLWEVATGARLASLTHPQEVRALAFRPDGKYLLSGCADGKARLWAFSSDRPLGRARESHHGGAVNAVAFSPDGRSFVTGSADRTARCWKTATGEPIGPPLEHPAEVKTVALASRERERAELVLTGCGDSGVRLWDATTGRMLGPVVSHPGAVNAVAFHPEGRAFVTASGSHAAQLWSLPAPLPEDRAVLTTWVEVITGATLEKNRTFKILDAASWGRRHQLLSQWTAPIP